MEDYRLDRVLDTLRQNMPRAPEKTVEKMVHTVVALEAKQMSQKNASQEKQPEIKKQNIELDLGQKGGPVL